MQTNLLKSSRTLNDGSLFGDAMQCGRNSRVAIALQLEASAIAHLNSDYSWILRLWSDKVGLVQKGT